VRSEAGRPASELLSYLRTLAGGAQPTQFFDLRYLAAGDDRMRRRFVSVLQFDQLTRHICELASDGDVYVGVVLRDRAQRGKAAIGGSRLLYIESDDLRAGERIAEFPYTPAMIVASGSPGHLHCYWQLHERARNAEVESANRRLAYALHGEPACSDIARMLRPPRTFNHKHAPPVPVTLLKFDADACHALTEQLPADPQPITATGTTAACRVDRTALDRQLLEIPAVQYVRVLANLEPSRAGSGLQPSRRRRGLVIVRAARALRDRKTARLGTLLSRVCRAGCAEGGSPRRWPSACFSRGA
jgi:RepB DNA-primase from phage plasmid